MGGFRRAAQQQVVKKEDGGRNLRTGRGTEPN